MQLKYNIIQLITFPSRVHFADFDRRILLSNVLKLFLSTKGKFGCWLARSWVHAQTGSVIYSQIENKIIWEQELVY